MMNIGVSGLGRIGRLVIRRVMDLENPNINLIAINTSHSVESMAHLLKYDTTHRKWDAQIEVVSDIELKINGHIIQVINFRDPLQLPWEALGVDLVIDATGKFKEKSLAHKHIEAGAKKVIVTAPGTNLDATIVMGVNDSEYDADRHHVVSSASCTTNCLAPVLKVLDDAFTVKQGWMTTIHSYTSDQNHLDNPHKDLRRARACAQSIIPTSTGVGKALIDVLPHLASRVQGMAVRVPTSDVSLVDLTVQLEKNVSKEEVAAAFSDFISQTSSPYVGITDEPLVSSDFIGDSRSAIVDSASMLVKENELKLLAWYDNEWGYACRVVDTAALISSFHKGAKQQWSETAV